MKPPASAMFKKVKFLNNSKMKRLTMKIRRMRDSIFEIGKELEYCSNPQPIVLDLFSGAGGMCLGFKSAGYLIALGVEKENFPSQTYRYNLVYHQCNVGDSLLIAPWYYMGYWCSFGADLGVHANLSFVVLQERSFTDFMGISRGLPLKGHRL